MPAENNDPVVQAAQTWLVVSTTPVAAAPTPAPVKPKAKRKKAVVVHQGS